MKHYTVLMIPDPDECGYTVLVPALPACITEGDDESEALENARDAIRLYLEDLEASGEPIPDERASPALVSVDM